MAARLDDVERPGDGARRIGDGDAGPRRAVVECEHLHSRRFYRCGLGSPGGRTSRPMPPDGLACSARLGLAVASPGGELHPRPVSATCLTARVARLRILTRFAQLLLQAGTTRAPLAAIVDSDPDQGGIHVAARFTLPLARCSQRRSCSRPSSRSPSGSRLAAGAPTELFSPSTSRDPATTRPSRSTTGRAGAGDADRRLRHPDLRERKPDGHGHDPADRHDRGRGRLRPRAERAVAALLALADQTTTNFLFNGNDAVALRSAGRIVDVHRADRRRSGRPSGAPGMRARPTTPCAASRRSRPGTRTARDAFDPALEWAAFRSTPSTVSAGIRSRRRRRRRQAAERNGRRRRSTMPSRWTRTRRELDRRARERRRRRRRSARRLQRDGSRRRRRLGRSGSRRYTPDVDFHGKDCFTYTISDGRGGLDTAAVSG